MERHLDLDQNVSLRHKYANSLYCLALVSVWTGFAMAYSESIFEYIVLGGGMGMVLGVQATVLEHFQKSGSLFNTVTAITTAVCITVTGCEIGHLTNQAAFNQVSYIVGASLLVFADTQLGKYKVEGK